MESRWNFCVCVLLKEAKHFRISCFWASWEFCYCCCYISKTERCRRISLPVLKSEQNPFPKKNQEPSPYVILFKLPHIKLVQACAKRWLPNQWLQHTLWEKHRDGLVEQLGQLSSLAVTMNGALDTRNNKIEAQRDHVTCSRSPS